MSEWLHPLRVERAIVSRTEYLGGKIFEWLTFRFPSKHSVRLKISIQCWLFCRLPRHFQGHPISLHLDYLATLWLFIPLWIVRIDFCATLAECISSPLSQNGFSSSITFVFFSTKGLVFHSPVCGAFDSFDAGIKDLTNKYLLTDFLVLYIVEYRILYFLQHLLQHCSFSIVPHIKISILYLIMNVICIGFMVFILFQLSSTRCLI